MFPRHWPRWHRCLLFAPDHRTVHRAWQTSSMLRNAKVFHLSLLHDNWNADATTSNRCTPWWKTNTLGPKPPLTCVWGSVTPYDNLILARLKIQNKLLVAPFLKLRARIVLTTYNDTVSNSYSIPQRHHVTFWQETPLGELRIPYKIL